MKKILVIRGISAYNVLSRAADDICRGFEKQGYAVDIIDAAHSDSEYQLKERLSRICEYSFYFSVQAILWDIEAQGIPELRQIRRVGWIVDDPVYHQRRLAGSAGEGAYVLCVRERHASDIREEFPKFEKVETLYHGGFRRDGNMPYEERDIEVFFPGTYTALSESERAVDAIEGVFGTVARGVMRRIVGQNLASSWTEELRNYLHEISFELDGDEFWALQRILYPLDQYQRDYMRQKVVEVLLVSGIKVSVAGAGWSAYEGEGKENLNILSDDGLDIDEVIGLMQRSKIVLNNTNILDGMHERIFSAMLAGAVCVTNEYTLLNNLFSGQDEIITFPLNDLTELPVKVNALLSDVKRAKKIAQAGYRVCEERHTWERRGEQIVKWLEDGLEFDYERLWD